jgi:uncharacterized DUF497 family protein
MEYGFDPKKLASNLVKHGVEFAAIEEFRWSSALVRADVREDYGEVRLTAIGLVGDRLHVAVFTVERQLVWLISLRRANRKEIMTYVASLDPSGGAALAR